MAAALAVTGGLFIGSELLTQLVAGSWLRSKFKAGGKIPLATVVLTGPLQHDRIYGVSPISYVMTLIGAGYFTYDLCVCVFRYEGLAYLFHGLTCFTLFSYAHLTGFLHYYVAMFLLWELSTPFVYGRWLLYNLNMAGSKLYVYNGLAMLASFFLARNLLGAFMLVDFFRWSGRELHSPRQPAQGAAMPPPVIWLYRAACVALSCLNAMWFCKMLRGAIRVLKREAVEERS